jgi:hypothetical protein
MIEFCSRVLGALLHADGTVRTTEELQEYNKRQVQAAQARLSRFNFEAFLKRTLRISCIPLQGPDGNLVRTRQLVLASKHAAAQHQGS